MTETRTLHFDNARQVQSLYANDLQLLKRMEDSLGVKVTTREGWVKIEGEPEKIEKAEVAVIVLRLQDGEFIEQRKRRKNFLYFLHSLAPP